MTLSMWLMLKVHIASAWQCLGGCSGLEVNMCYTWGVGEMIQGDDYGV